jgi:hypothetical protein
MPNSILTPAEWSQGNVAGSGKSAGKRIMNALSARNYALAILMKRLRAGEPRPLTTARATVRTRSAVELAQEA